MWMQEDSFESTNDCAQKPTSASFKSPVSVVCTMNSLSFMPHARQVSNIAAVYIQCLSNASEVWR